MSPQCLTKFFPKLVGSKVETRCPPDEPQPTNRLNFSVNVKMPPSSENTAIVSCSPQSLVHRCFLRYFVVFLGLQKAVACCNYKIQVTTTNRLFSHGYVKTNGDLFQLDLWEVPVCQPGQLIINLVHCWALFGHVRSHSSQFFWKLYEFCWPCSLEAFKQETVQSGSCSRMWDISSKGLFIVHSTV